MFNSSVAGITGGVVGGHYASSKAAVHGLVHWLAGSVAKKGITVNAVAPALIEDTAMLPSGGEELAKSKLIVHLSMCLVSSSIGMASWLGCLEYLLICGYRDPVGRFGRPEEIADTVLWMVKNAYVTNKVIAVDGGMAYSA